MGAPLNPVPQVLRIFLEGVVDNNDIYKWGNVIHAAYTGGPPSDADCRNLAGGIESQWVTHMAPECPAPTQLTVTTVTDLTSPASGEGSFTGDDHGTRGDDSIPANAAFLISYPVLGRYKGGHPRSYLYVGGNADLNGAAEWATAFVAEVRSHWHDFLINVVGLGAGTTTIASVGSVRYRGKYLPNGGPPHFYLTNPIYLPWNVGEMVAHAEIASQRRRVGRRKA